MRRRLRTVGLVVLAVVVGAALAVVFRGRIVAVILELVVPRVLGYGLHVDDVRFDTAHAGLFGVHVTRNGDPVLDAKRVDLEYHLRDLFPGGKRRFGFVAASIDKPVLTVVRHTDGSFNIATGAGTSTVPAATRAQARPFYFTARMRDGVLVFRDLGQQARDLREQRVEGLRLDASIQTDARSSYHLAGTLRGSPESGTPERAYPLRIDGAVDYDRGFATHRFRAKAVPLRGPVAGVLHTPAVHVDAGELHDLDFRLFAVGITANAPFAYQAGGSGTLVDGRVTIAAFAEPVRALNGPVTFYGDGLATSGARGTIAGVPVRARGGFFDLARPTFRLALDMAGELGDLKHVFGFAARQPLAGAVRIGALLESRIDTPLVLVHVIAPHVSYAKVPFDDAVGDVTYYDSTVTIAPLRARYGAATLGIAGRLILPGDGRELDTGLVLLAQAPAAKVPYAAEFVPSIDALHLAAYLSGRGTAFRLSGSLAGSGGGTDISALFAVDDKGYGSYGPLAIDRPGESLVGGLRLDRRAGYDGAWVSARNVRVAPPPNGVAFPGAKVPEFPNIGGTLDGELAAAGPPSDLGIAGGVRLRNLRVAGIAADSASARLAGSFASLRLEDIRFAAPFGTFRGRGAIEESRVALEGRFAGSFEGLRPFTGDLGAHGVVSGPVSIVTDAHGTVLQLDGGTTRADIRGLAFGGLSGTIAIDPQKHLHIVAARADLAGGSAVAADSGRGRVAFSTSGLDVRQLGLGETLDAGRLDAFGTATVPQHAGDVPNVDAGFALAGGRARGYPLDARASLGIANDRVTIGAGFAVLAGTEATFDGAIAGLGTTPTYDLTAGVRGGDLGIVRDNIAAFKPLRTLDGSVDANLRVSGSGVRPRVVGAIAIPEGSYNGLAFHNGTAHVDAANGAVALDRGSVRVGSTTTTFSGAMTGDRLSADVRSERADLADFNDYFDAGDTLGGLGRFAAAYEGTPSRIVSHGSVAFTGLRYRRLVLGDANLAWKDAGPAGNALAVALDVVSGTSGAFAAHGTIGLNRGGPQRAFRDATYAIDTTLRGVDLGVWLPAVGLQYPVVGSVDADGHLTGRYPQLALDTSATLRNGQVAGVALQRAVLTTRTENGRTVISEAAVDVQDGTLRGSGSFGLAQTSPLDLTFTAATPDLRAFLAQTIHRPYDVAGSLESNVRVTGTLAAPRVTGGFDIVDPRIARFTANRAFGSLALAGANVQLLDAEIEFQRGTLSLSGEVPLQVPSLAIGPATAPVSFLIQSRGVDISSLASSFGNTTKLSGVIDGRLGVAGTVGAPRLSGDLALSGGSYASNLERQPLKNVTGSLAFAGSRVRITRIHADAGKGTIDGSGAGLLPIVPGSGLAFDIRLLAKAAQLDLPQYATGTVDGALDISRAVNDSAPLVSGNLALTNAVIPVGAIYNPNAPPPDPNAVPGFDPALDLSVAAGKNVRIRNPFIDVGATGQATVGGTLLAPRLNGEFTATNGTFNILSRAFRVQSATVTFTPADGLTPQVDLRALARVSTQRDSFDVTTIVSGPSNNLTTKFATDRNYSKDEILAYLSGASALGFNAATQAQLPGTLRGLPPVVNALTPPQLVRVPNSAFSLSEAGFDILNTQLTQNLFSPFENFFASTLGLTSFGVNLDYTGGIGFTARKEIKRDVYLVYSQTVTTPVRETLGVEARPDRDTSLRLTGFTQQGTETYLGGAYNPFGTQTVVRTTANLPIGGQSGFSLTLTKLYP